MHSKDIENFLNAFKQAKIDLPFAETAVKSCEDRLQDLNHMLELDNLSYHEGAKAAKEIAAVRKERRRAKDTIEILSPIVTYCDNNKRFLDHLTQLLGEIRKVEKWHNTRTYTPKSK